MKPPPVRPDELRRIMRHHDGKVDACIVGSGTAGGVLAKELAEAGMTVVACGEQSRPTAADMLVSSFGVTG